MSSSFRVFEGPSAGSGNRPCWWRSNTLRCHQENVWPVNLYFHGRSCIYRRNKKEPRTETLGTPDVTGILDYFSASKATRCEGPSSKAFIQLILFRVIPCGWSLKSNSVWLTLSIASLKSRSMRSVWRPNEIPWIDWINWVSQDLRSLKLWCRLYCTLWLLRCLVRFDEMTEIGR